MEKKLILASEEKTLKERVLSELSFRNHKVLIRCERVPQMRDVILKWTSDRSPMVVNVNVQRCGLVVLFATGTTLTFVVNDVGDTSKYDLVIDEREKNEVE